MLSRCGALAHFDVDCHFRAGDASSGAGGSGGSDAAVLVPHCHCGEYEPELTLQTGPTWNDLVEMAKIDIS